MKRASSDIMMMMATFGRLKKKVVNMVLGIRYIEVLKLC